MATTTNISTTYAGEKLPGYISSALLSGNTLANNLITVKPNIALKAVVSKMELSGILKDATCDFTPQGVLTKTERIITPKELQVNMQLCKTDFLQDWDALQVGGGLNTNLPNSVSDYVMQRMAAVVAQSVEQAIYRGDSGNDGEFDGFFSLLAADSDVLDVSGTTVDASNVITELRKVTALIPDALYLNPDFRIIVSRNVMQAYVQALGGFGASGLGANGINGMGSTWYNAGASLSIDGIPLVMGDGMSANKMIAAQSSNLWFGTHLLSDLNEAQLIDMSQYDGSKNVRFVLRFRAAVQYGIGSEIVYYTA